MRYKFEFLFPAKYRKFNHPIINHFRAGKKGGQKSALLSYTTEKYRAGRNEAFYHNSFAICEELINSLNILGYSVDLVDYRDVFFHPRKTYDIFIGHGGINFEDISSKLGNKCTKIYFATGSYWEYHNNEEIKRFSEFTKRTGINAQPDRFIINQEEGALKSSDLIVVLGNNKTKSTYSDFGNVVSINGIVCEDDWEKDRSTMGLNKKNFLFYSGYGNIHKGLDVLIESFNNSDLNLFVITNIDSPIIDAYGKQIQASGNIKLLGWVNYRTKDFYDAVNKSTFVILPSCSEGQAISVLECARYGLIPVVSESCGIDVEGYGEIIQPCTIGNIKSVCEKLVSTDNPELSRKSDCSINSVKYYSREKFRENIMGIVNQL